MKGFQDEHDWKILDSTRIVRTVKKKYGKPVLC